MGSPVTVRNFIDTWVNESGGHQWRNYGEGTRIRLESGTPDRKYGFLYFNKPWPAGARIISAKLVLRSAEYWPEAVTLTVQRASAKWNVNSIHWNNQPGVTGSTAQVSRTGAPAGGVWEIDVTAIMQTVANGAAWYGLVLTTNRTTTSKLYSAQSAAQFRPTLVVEWVEEPDEPDNLSPGGGRVISVAKPIVTFDLNDNTGDTILSAVQVQLGTSEANVEAGAPLTYDSGEVASTVPELDLARADLPGGVYPGLADAATTWWRCRGKDSTNSWGFWSSPTSFTRDAQGVLAMTNPGVDLRLTDPSPVITWTLTGAVQEHYQVWIWDTEERQLVWSSGKITSTATSASVPFGVVSEDKQFTVWLRVWDDAAREPIPGDPAYLEVVRDVEFYYDGTIGATAANLSVVSDPLLPVAHLTWDRSGVNVPDSWLIQRSADGGATWSFIAEETAADLFTGGVAYAYDDATAGSYTPHQWRVIAVYLGKMATGPVTSGEIRRLAPFLLRRNGTDAVVFLNPKRKRERTDIQEIHETMAGPVLVTQVMGRYRGSVEGLLAPESGIATADELLARFHRLRRDTGVPMTVVIANKSYKVVAYNFQDDVVTDSSGIMYLASFDWFEIP